MTVAVQSSTRVQGILCVFGAMGALSLQDSIIKELSDRFPLHEIVLWRTAIAIVITVFIAHFEGGVHVLATRRPLLHLTRGMLLVLANLTFFLALAAMPLAEAVAIFFIAPLLITALSVPMLGERVGARRWAAVVVGFAGVVVIVEPFDGVIEFAALLPLAAAAAYALMQMLTRRLGVTDRASTLAFYIQICMFFASGVIGLAVGDGHYAGGGHPSLEFLLRPWSWPFGDDTLLLTACGFLVAAGGYLLSQAYRIAEANVVAPFEYAALPMAVLWGFLFWNELPDPIAWLGICLIVGSGLYVLYRESIRGRAIASDHPMPRNR